MLKSSIPPHTINTVSRSHNNYIAIAKAIGIISVVIWHSRPPQEIGILLMFYAVPLFFFTSGFFYKPCHTKDQLKTTYLKRFKGLYLPFLKWSLVFLLLHNIFFHLNIYNGVYGFEGKASELYNWKDFILRGIHVIFKVGDVEQLLGAFWFIRALLFSSLMIATIHFILRRYIQINRYIVCLILLGLSFVSLYYKLRLPYIGSLYILFFSSFFYVTGYCYHKIESERCYSNIAFILSLVLTGIGLIFFNHVAGVLENSVEDVLPYSIFAISGILLVLNISKRIEHFKVQNFLYYVGNNTMIILAMHLLTFKLISLAKIAYYSWPIERLAEFPAIEQNNSVWWLAYTLVGVGIPLILSKSYNILVNKLYVERWFRTNRRKL